ncbi:hypothetical protein [Nocardia acidivorans]|uniref:hypothetical protein n=1 Tax=Nocardia acidivorans TaxID=404580 RepID=UPI00082F1A92|nr:hypothetical protein [Nocardia acidivorans]
MSTAPTVTDAPSTPEADAVDPDTTSDTPDAPQGGEQESGSVDAPEGGEGTAGAPQGSKADDPRLRTARNDAASYRTRAKKAETDLTEFKNQVGKLFGFVSDEDASDPKKLTAQLKSAVDEAHEARIELAVFRAAGKEIDADALLDSRTFAATVSKLDASADDFAAQVAAEIAKAVEKSPKFRLAPAAEPPKPPKRSGADTGSGKGENSGQLTYAQYQALSPTERVKAVKEGRANQILGRK